MQHGHRRAAPGPRRPQVVPQAGRRGDADDQPGGEESHQVLVLQPHAEHSAGDQPESRPVVLQDRDDQPDQDGPHQQVERRRRQQVRDREHAGAGRGRTAASSCAGRPPPRARARSAVTSTTTPATRPGRRAARPATRAPRGRRAAPAAGSAAAGPGSPTAGGHLPRGSTARRGAVRSGRQRQQEERRSGRDGVRRPAQPPAGAGRLYHAAPMATSGGRRGRSGAGSHRRAPLGCRRGPRRRRCPSRGARRRGPAWRVRATGSSCPRGWSTSTATRSGRCPGACPRRSRPWSSSSGDATSSRRGTCTTGGTRRAGSVPGSPAWWAPTTTRSWSATRRRRTSSRHSSWPPGCAPAAHPGHRAWQLPGRPLRRRLGRRPARHARGALRAGGRRLRPR